MNARTIIRISLILAVCLFVACGEEYIGTFPEMLAKGLEESVNRQRHWFYIFEGDGSCERTTASALDDERVKSAVDKAIEAGMDIRVIIPSPSTYDNIILSERNQSLEVKILSKEALKEIPEEVYAYFQKVVYLSGDFVCQELRCGGEDDGEHLNRKYVKRYGYAPKTSGKLKKVFEELWQKAVSAPL